MRTWASAVDRGTTHVRCRPIAATGLIGVTLAPFFSEVVAEHGRSW